jgi:hypothetical protein
MNELIAEGAIPALLNQRGGDTKVMAALTDASVVSLSLRASHVMVRSQLTVMVGNPRAVTENKRFMEKNLNRIIHPVRILPPAITINLCTHTHTHTSDR